MKNKDIEKLILKASKTVNALPDNLEVGGDLYLESTDITALPDNLGECETISQLLALLLPRRW